MNFAGGAIIAANGIDSFLPVLIAAGAVSFIASLGLPHEPAPSHHSELASVRRDAIKLGTQPLFLLFVAAAGIGQACHSFYYAFGTLNWKALDYDPTLIGLLWALGVIAEIVLLMFSSRAVRRLGPIRLLLIGTGAGLVRWTALAFSPPLWLLIPIQCLHAGTFCAVHLGTMHFILRAVPPHLVGTAQSIFAAISIGLFFSIGQYGSGLLFASFGSLGYLAMTAMSALAFGLSLLLGRLWDGGVLRPRG
jgi:PPP family 3-phenylpropionic acid transporter